MNKFDLITENIKGVIFDMDGTLIDSMHIWADIDAEFIIKMKVMPPENMKSEIEGKSMAETASYFKEKFNLPESVEEIVQSWNEMAMYKYSHEIKLKEGALEFLNNLKDKKIKLGIATSNSRTLACACLENLKIKDLFDAIITGDEVTHGKPDPEIYLLAAEEMKVFPSDCLIFEDVVMGINAGIAAGMKTCAIYDKWNEPNEERKKEIADYYIKSFVELQK